MRAFRDKFGDIAGDGICGRLHELMQEFLAHEPAAVEKKREAAGMKN